MNDEEMERWLRESGEPGPGVERAVLDAYDRAFGRRRFWRRPVPLYQAAAGLVVVAGLALAAGRLTGGSAPEPGPEPAAAPPAATGWSTAAPDILVAG